jgi:hypothetical protein
MDFAVGVLSRLRGRGTGEAGGGGGPAHGARNWPPSPVAGRVAPLGPKVRSKARVGGEARTEHPTCTRQPPSVRLPPPSLPPRNGGGKPALHACLAPNYERPTTNSKTCPRPPTTRISCRSPRCRRRRDERLAGRPGGWAVGPAGPIRVSPWGAILPHGAAHAPVGLTIAYAWDSAGQFKLGRVSADAQNPGARRGHGLAYRRMTTARTRAPPRRLHIRRQTADQPPGRRAGRHRRLSTHPLKALAARRVTVP